VDHSGGSAPNKKEKKSSLLTEKEMLLSRGKGKKKEKGYKSFILLSWIEGKWKKKETLRSVVPG